MRLCCFKRAGQLFKMDITGRWRGEDSHDGLGSSRTLPGCARPRAGAAETSVTPGPLAASHPPSMDAARSESLLHEVMYPGLGRDVVSLGIVAGVAACGGRVKVELALRTRDPDLPDRLRGAITERLHAGGAREVSVVFAAPPRGTRAAGASDPWADQIRLGRVRHVVAGGAGKGGVGKSTVAVNLALALRARGGRVALLDADIYGPSLPILLGVADGARRVRLDDERAILPLAAWGVPLISFGFFLGAESPAIWRGPMVSKAVKQFARGVRWPDLDVLLVDLPPGTGDVPLSLAQAIVLAGGVVVTQPQRVATAEAGKAADMFRALGVPVLGVVENMTGAFGAGGGAALGARLGVPLLASVPFDPVIVEEGDAGRPVVACRPDAPAALAFASAAEAMLGTLDGAAAPA